MNDRGFRIIVHPYRKAMPGPSSGGPWLVRCYTDADEHVHSAEGGVSLHGGLSECERAIERYLEAEAVQSRVLYPREVGWTHVGCKKCGAVLAVPLRPGEDPPWCVHSNLTVKWRPPMTREEGWTQMVRVKVLV